MLGKPHQWHFLSPWVYPDKNKPPLLSGSSEPQKKPRRETGALEKHGNMNQPQVRFLWRFDRERFLRLCCEILRRRFFLKLPIMN
jgi:hypothetical protein